MPNFARTAGIAVCALTFFGQALYGQRAFITKFAAWKDPSIVMVIGKIIQVTPPRQSPGQSPDRIALYEFQVSEWLKPRGSDLPQRITISETWGATDTAVFRPGIEVLLFLQGNRSRREIHLDSLEGQQTLKGVRLFLDAMYQPDAAQRRKACLEAWDDRLSDPEKRSVLDEMWETRTPEYSATLLKIALGNSSPDVRAWALTILASIGNDEGVERLVPMRLTDSDCDVRRQLLLVFGVYRVQQAVTAIDELLAGKHPSQCLSWQANALQLRAQEARDKITGKDPRPGNWRN